MAFCQRGRTEERLFGSTNCRSLGTPTRNVNMWRDCHGKDRHYSWGANNWHNARPVISTEVVPIVHGSSWITGFQLHHGQKIAHGRVLTDTQLRISRLLACGHKCSATDGHSPQSKGLQFPNPNDEEDAMIRDV